MCKPSCCRNDSGPGPGIAAAAILMVAAFTVTKIGPAVARLIQIVLEMIRFAALATGLVVALAALTWTAVQVISWQRCRCAELVASPAREFVMPERRQAWRTNQPSCLACGGTGTVLRAIGAGRYQPGSCPVCEPARQAG